LQWKREGINQAERISREVNQCAEIWGSDEHVAVVQKFLKKR